MKQHKNSTRFVLLLFSTPQVRQLTGQGNRRGLQLGCRSVLVWGPAARGHCEDTDAEHRGGLLAPGGRGLAHLRPHNLFDEGEQGRPCSSSHPTITSEPARRGSRCGP